jgi:hypothetical protein
MLSGKNFAAKGHDGPLSNVVRRVLGMYPARRQVYVERSDVLWQLEIGIET